MEMASDVSTGLQLATSGRHVLILLDLAIPGGDGLDVLDELRKGSSIPIIVVTGVGTRDIEAEAIKRGARAVLHKPFRLEKFFEVVQAAIRSSG